MAFVIDASSSVGLKNFRKFKKFVENISKNFVIGPKNVRVGAVVFSSRPELAFGLNRALDKKTLIKTIRRQIR